MYVFSKYTTYMCHVVESKTLCFDENPPWTNPLRITMFCL